MAVSVTFVVEATVLGIAAAKGWGTSEADAEIAFAIDSCLKSVVSLMALLPGVMAMRLQYHKTDDNGDPLNNGEQGLGQDRQETAPTRVQLAGIAGAVAAVAYILLLFIFLMTQAEEADDRYLPLFSAFTFAYSTFLAYELLHFFYTLREAIAEVNCARSQSDWNGITSQVLRVNDAISTALGTYSILILVSVVSPITLATTVHKQQVLQVGWNLVFLAIAVAHLIGFTLALAILCWTNRLIRCQAAAEFRDDPDAEGILALRATHPPQFTIGDRPIGVWEVLLLGGVLSSAGAVVNFVSVSVGGD